MNLSGDQVKTFWSMWAKACRKQGWTAKAEIEAKRKELLARCGFKSLTLVDRLDGFTKVKNELLLLISDHTDLKAAAETENPELNQARVFKHKIMNELLPCLALYEEDVAGYLTSVMEDKNRWWKIDRPACQITLEDLDAKPIFRFRNGERKEFPSTLEQLMMTLNARVNTKRKAAGHSGHEMKLRAQVFCDCAKCEKARLLAAVVPPLPTGTDSQPDTAEIMEQGNGETPF
jgi:hypothetical protein